jgi:hypothetical protein
LFFFLSFLPMSLDNSPVNFAQPNDVTGRSSSETNNYMPGSEHAGLSPAIVESIAGLSAGTVATLVVHPLDIVKTRMQSKDFTVFVLADGAVFLHLSLR